MDAKLHVGLIGYGYAGKTIHAPLIQSVPGMRLSAVLSSDAAKAHRDLPGMPVPASLSDLLADPQIELVVIATPNDTHFDLARQALLAGKAAVVDKPFTVHTHEGRDLIALARKTGRFLSVFHNRRWDGGYLTLRDLLSRGELGEVVHFESHFDRYRPEVRQRWRELSGPGAGLFYDIGPHLVDQALQLLGRPMAVHADLAAQRTGSVTVDYFHVVLRYPKARAILHAGNLVSGGTPRYIVHGTRGSFVQWGLDVQEDALKRGGRPGDADWGVDDNPAQLFTVKDGVSTARPVPIANGCYQSYYQAVYNALRHGKPNPVPPEQALQTMELLELAMISSARRQELTWCELHKKNSGGV